jgi:hypothetical protein
MVAVLIMMTAFASCKKDSNSSGGDEPPVGENPFLGKWIMDDNDAVTVEFKASTWVIKNENVTFCSGTYTYTGKTATLTVTDTGMSDAEEGDVGTAKVSGKKLTVDFDGDESTFTKEGGDNPPPPPPPPPPDGFVIDATVVNGNSYNGKIATVKAVTDYFLLEYIVATCKYENGGFKLILPETVKDNLGSITTWCGQNFEGTISDKDTKRAMASIGAFDSSDKWIGTFGYEDGSNWVDFIYVDRDVTVKGKSSATYGENIFNEEYDCTFKKGWNMMYVAAESFGSEYFYVNTTKKPSGVNFQWNYDDTVFKTNHPQQGDRMPHQQIVKY